jgi:hypothetical protein
MCLIYSRFLKRIPLQRAGYFSSYDLRIRTRLHIINSWVPYSLKSPTCKSCFHFVRRVTHASGRWVGWRGCDDGGPWRLCGRPVEKVVHPYIHRVPNSQSASFRPPRSGRRRVPVFLSEISDDWRTMPLDIKIGIDSVVHTLIFGQRGFMRA